MDTHLKYVGIRYVKKKKLNGRVCFNVGETKYVLKGATIKGKNMLPIEWYWLLVEGVRKLVLAIPMSYYPQYSIVIFSINI